MAKNKIPVDSGDRPLTEIEKGFIEGKQNVSARHLYETYFSDTDVSIEMIQSYLTDLIEIKKAGPVGEAIISEQHEHGRQGMAIMTREASERTDDRRAKYQPKKADNSGHIHRIRKVGK